MISTGYNSFRFARFDGDCDGLDQITRRQYARRTARYASGMTDREWGLVQATNAASLGPSTDRGFARGGECPALHGRNGQWRMLSQDFPPFSTVQCNFHEWRGRALGLCTGIDHRLVMKAREALFQEKN